MFASKAKHTFRTTLQRLTLADLSLVLVVVGAVLRIKLWLMDASLWADEEMVTLNIRDRSFWRMAGFLDMHQNAPLGWLQLEWLLGHGVGFGEKTLRVTALIFGIATLFAAWWVARRWFSALGGLMFVGLCAIGPHLVYYSSEVKPYALDAFFALVMMAIAATIMDVLRATPRNTDPASTGAVTRLKRLMWGWWIFATVAGWFSLAAVQVALPIGAILTVLVWWKCGKRTALRMLLPGLVWLAVFVIHFALAIRYTIGDRWLETAWQYAYAPRPYGLNAFTRWFGQIFVGIAFKPVGIYSAGLAVTFWVLVALGVAVIARWRKDLAALVVTPLATVLILAVLRLAPPVDRIVLWIVPSLFAAIAALFQGAVTWAFRRGSVLAELLERESWHWPTRWAAATAAVVAMLGVAGVFLIRPMTSQLSEMPQWWQQKSNDRAAVRWLERHHQPDDLVLTPFLSRFAVSWYAHSPRWNREPSSLAPVELLHHGQPGIWCDPGQLQRAVSGHRRVLFFQGPEFFPGLETILSARLKQLGTPVGRVHRFGKVGFVRVFDVSRPPAAQNQGLSGHEAAALSRPDSCVTVMSYRSFY